MSGQKKSLVERAFVSRRRGAASNTPEEFAAFIKAEIVKWGKVTKAAGIEPQ